MSADLELQRAIRERLISTPAVTALVPAANILDRNERPALRPSIILGETQMLDEGDSYGRKRHRIAHTIHVWIEEPSTEGAKKLAWAIFEAIRAGRLELGTGFRCTDARVFSSRFLRDPNGTDTHGVIVVDALVTEAP